MKLNVIFIVVMLAVLCSSLFGQVTWQQAAGPYGESVWANIVLNNGTLLAGLGDGRIFRYVSNTEGWTKTYEAEATWRAFAQLNNGDELATNANALLVRSQDNGQTWTSVTPGFGAEFDIRDLLVDSTKIYAATAHGILVSEDNGTNWTTTSFTNYVFALEKDNSGNVYAATYQGVFSSTDSFQTSTMITSGINDFLSLHFNGTTLFAGTGMGIYKYNGTGTDWIAIGMEDGSINQITSLGTNLIVSGNFGIKFSSDGGDSWYETSITDDNVKGGLAVNTNNNSVYAAGMNGMYTNTSVNLEEWKKIGVPVPATFMYRYNNEIYTGTFNGSTSSVCLTNNAGDNWEEITSALNSSIYNIAKRQDQTMYVGISGGFSGTAWINAYNPLAQNDWENWLQLGFPSTQYAVKSIYVASNDSIYASAEHGIYRVTFIPNAEFPVMDVIELGLTDRVVNTIIEGIDGEIIAGTDNGLYKSTDLGATWAPFALNAVAVNRIVKAADSYYFAATDTGIYNSFDAIDWVPVNSGLPTSAYSIITPDMYDNIYTVNDNQIYRSTDQGQSWTSFATNLAEYEVNDILACNSDLYFASNLGVYKTSIQPQANDDTNTISTPLAISNYPNPFNPETNIQFSLSHPSVVTISIYNTKGQLVNHLANQQFAQGTHSVIWNGKDTKGTSLASGIYFCKITSDKQSATHKMLLVK